MNVRSLASGRRGWPPRLVAGIAGAALWSLLFVCGAAAQVTTELHEVNGVGPGRQEAVQAALQQAAFQVCGVNIESDTASTVSVAVRDDGAEIIERLNERIRLTTGKDGCRFTGYEVLDAIRGDDGMRVRVQVRYSTYRVPGPAVERRRIAVLDFEMDEVHLYGAGGERERRSGGRAVQRGVDVDFDLIRNLQNRFRARIEELLTQGRRFAVLDRHADAAYEQEKLLLLSSDVDPAEAARLGNVLGADYLLYGTVDRIAVEEQRTTIQLTGESRTRTVGIARVRFSALAVGTRQVKWSSSIESERVAEEDLWPEQLAEALLDEVAARIVDELTENIYPPVVTQVVGPGRFAVNRGGNTVQVGDLFEVFGLGAMMVDPDTGESLGRLETTVGFARVAQVKPKYSLADLILATGSIAEGMVLRRYRGDIEDIADRYAVAAPQSGEGGDRNYQRTTGDGDGDGLPDYLNRNANTGDTDRDGLPDYLNRNNLRRR